MEPYDVYLSHLEANKSANTVAAYRRDLTAYIHWLAGHGLEPLTARPEQVVMYRHHLGLDHAPASVNRALAAVKAWYRWLEDQGHCTSNIAAGVKMRACKVDNTTVKWLTPQQTELLLLALRREKNVAKTARDESIICLMLWAGLRVSEVCALKMSDISLVRSDASILIRHGKGGKVRTVPVSDKLRRVLMQWAEHRRHYRLSAHSPYVVVGERTPGMSRAGLDRVVRKYLQHVGIEHHSCHSLRHTFAKRLAENGIRLEEIARLCGHENLETTRIYVEPSAQELRLAVNAL